MSRFVALAAAALLLPLAGCVGEVGASNFELAPDRAGWNVGQEASFTLRIKPTLSVEDPSYAIDPEIALEEVRLDEKGVRLGGDVSTRTPSELGLRLLHNGSLVESHTMTLAEPELTVRVFLPEDLRDSTYVLGLRLFHVGWVESEAFRVNRP